MNKCFKGNTMAYQKRTPRFDWQALINQQQESDIPVAQFCRDNQLSPSAFYHNRVKLSKKPSSPVNNFITAQIMTPVTPITAPLSFTLSYSGVELSIPALTSPEVIAQLMRGIAS